MTDQQDAMYELRNEAVSMSLRQYAGDKIGVARLSARTGDIETDHFKHADIALAWAEAEQHWAIALDGFIYTTSAADAPISPSPAQTPMQPDNAQPTPTGGALEAMTDTDLKARAEAAWAYLFVYLDEIRRRAGIVVQSEEIPF